MIQLTPSRPQLLSDRELAHWLRVPLRCVHAEAAEGRLPAVRVGDRYFFDRSAVEETLRIRAQGPPGPHCLLGGPSPLAGRVDERFAS